MSGRLTVLIHFEIMLLEEFCFCHAEPRPIKKQWWAFASCRIQRHCHAHTTYKDTKPTMLLCRWDTMKQWASSALSSLC